MCSTKIKFPIYYFEDVDVQDIDEGLVGKKGLSLFKLKEFDVPVPPFFVISSTLFKDCIYKAFSSKVMQWANSDTPPSSDELMGVVEAIDFENHYKDDISKNYSRLSGFSDVWVSVRSSVVYTKDSSVSFSGIFATELNVKGFANVIQAVKNVYASAFSEKALSYYKIHGIKLSDVKMAVVVQKMVQAQVSGISFTVDPVTMDNEKMSIEAVFGLGEVISNNEMTPDLYVLKKEDLSFLEKRIAPQDWMLVRKPVPVDGRKYRTNVDYVEKVSITSGWSHQQKLEDRFVQDVAKLCLIIEDKTNRPQNVEWVWESGSVWILQNKELMEHEKSLIKEPMDFMSEAGASSEKDDFFESAYDIVGEKKIEEGSVKEAVAYVEKMKDKEKFEVIDFIGKDMSSKISDINSNDDLLGNQGDRDLNKAENVTKTFSHTFSHIGLTNHNLDESSSESFEMYLKGVGASFGKVVGSVLVLDKSSLKKIDVSKDKILLIKDYQSQNITDLEHIVLQAGGVITEEGGLSSDIAILCRESNIPAVVDVDNAVEKLSEGEKVRIDGTKGVVYRIVESAVSDSSPIPDKKDEMSGTKEDNNDGFLNQFEGIEEQLSYFEKGKSKHKEDSVEDNEANFIIKRNEIFTKINVPAPTYADSEEKPLDKDNVDDSDDSYYTFKENKFSDLDRLMGLKKEIESKYEKKLDKEHQNMVREKELETIVYDDKKKIVTATKVYVDYNYAKGAVINPNEEALEGIIKLSDGLCMVDFDKIAMDMAIHPMASFSDGNFDDYAERFAKKIDRIVSINSGEEAIILFGGLNNKSYQKMIKGESYVGPDTIDLDGIEKYYSSPDMLRKLLKIVRKARNKYKSRNISIAMRGKLGKQMILDFKKELSAIGLHRSNSFKIYVLVDKVSEIMFLDDIASADVDGIIFDFPQLAKEIAGEGDLRYLSIEEEIEKSAKWDSEYINALQKMLSLVCGNESLKNIKKLAYIDGSTDLLEQVIKAGFFGVSVRFDLLPKVKDAVSKYESYL